MIAALLLAATAPQASAPRPGELKTFADWTVGCDNVRTCEAVALLPEGDDRDAYLLLVLKRGGDGAAKALLSVPSGAGTPATLAVDGKPVARFATGKDAAAAPLTGPLTTALANGKTATLIVGGRTVAHASLAGLAAAMLYIDDRQQRLGTVGALRRPGAKADASVVAPPLPVIASPAPTSKPPRTITPAAAARLIGKDATTCDDASPVAPEAHRLDAAHTLVMVPHPCGNGAYNAFTSIYVVDESGRVTEASFDTPVGMGEDVTNELTNGGWDAKTRRLSDYVKARGVGDCGGSSEFAWDGARFRLVKATGMGECRGSIDWITTWRARVTTR
jgi:invasion protein IalB